MDVGFREIAGVRTRVLSVRGTGTPILLLHGFSDHAPGWRALLRELEARGHAALALDLPGFGRADRMRPGPVLPQLAEFVEEAVRRIAAEQGPPLVVGNSLGGAAVWAAAQRSRLPLAGIVAIAPAGFGFTQRVRLGRRILTRTPAGTLFHPFPCLSCGSCSCAAMRMGPAPAAGSTPSWRARGSGSSPGAATSETRPDWWHGSFARSTASGSCPSRRTRC